MKNIIGPYWDWLTKRKNGENPESPVHTKICKCKCGAEKEVPLKGRDRYICDECKDKKTGVRKARPSVSAPTTVTSIHTPHSEPHIHIKEKVIKEEKPKERKPRKEKDSPYVQVYRGIEIDRMGLDNVFFMDICNLIDRSPSLIVHEKPATVHGRNPIVRSELLDLLENKFHSFSEIQQSNLRIYITNNKLTNVIKLPNEQSI